MEARTLSHSMASCSGVCRPSRPALRRLVAAPARQQHHPLRVCAVAGLSRDSPTLEGHSLNAPSAEEDRSPVPMVHGPQEFEALMAANKGKMVVLMAKATHCRPCKLFAKKYAAAALQYPDALFLQITGDENKETRAMMIGWKVKVTPSFLIFRDGQKVHQHGGINETNLHRYISQHLKEGEAGFGTFVEPAEGAGDN